MPEWVSRLRHGARRGVGHAPAGAPGGAHERSDIPLIELPDSVATPPTLPLPLLPTDAPHLESGVTVNVPPTVGDGRAVPEDGADAEPSQGACLLRSVAAHTPAADTSGQYGSFGRTDDTSTEVGADILATPGVVADETETSSRYTGKVSRCVPAARCVLACGVPVGLLDGRHADAVPATGRVGTLFCRTPRSIAPGSCYSWRSFYTRSLRSPIKLASKSSCRSVLMCVRCGALFPAVRQCAAYVCARQIAVVAVFSMDVLINFRLCYYNKSHQLVRSFAAPSSGFAVPGHHGAHRRVLHAHPPCRSHCPGHVCADDRAKLPAHLVHI